MNYSPERSKEVRKLLSLSSDELQAQSAGHLIIKKDLDKLYTYLASEMVEEFRKAASRQHKTAFIMPVGPTQPYKIMAEKINAENLSLKNCVFFFMDEYCNDDGSLISEEHPLSFRRQIKILFFNLVRKELLMPEAQRIFPTPENLAKLPMMIEDVGGIEVCYGGIGIHGHVAFNEPSIGVKDTDPRILEINDFTRTVDSVRHGIGGNLVNFPRKAITLGMKQCLSARRILLMTRNEHKGMDWANTVLRISALGQPGDDYPVTHIRNHRNYIIASDTETSKAPAIII